MRLVISLHCERSDSLPENTNAAFSVDHSPDCTIAAHPVILVHTARAALRVVVRSWHASKTAPSLAAHAKSAPIIEMQPLTRTPGTIATVSAVVARTPRYSMSILEVRARPVFLTFNKGVVYFKAARCEMAVVRGSRGPRAVLICTCVYAGPVSSVSK